MRAALLVLSGCGRIGFEPLDPPAPDAMPCTSFGAWTTPIRQPVSSGTVSDLAPTIHPNKLVLVYDAPVGGDRQLFISLRSTVAEDFTTATQLVVGPAASSSLQPAWSPDGTQLHFHQFNANDERLVATYLGGTSFGAAALDAVPINGDNPFYSADESELFYTTYLATTALTYAHREGGVYVEDMTYFQPVNTDPNDEGYPSLDEGRQTLYYEEAIPAGTPAHISTATRNGPGQPFTQAGALTDFEQLGSTGDPDVSRDGTTLVFASDMGGANADLYLSTRPCL